VEPTLATMTSDSREQRTPPVHFDAYAENYDAALNQGLSATGESKDYFARRRIEWLAQRLQQLSANPRFIMDYGCGSGSSSNLLLETFNAEVVIGTDTSEKSLHLANRVNSDPRVEFTPIEKYEPKENLDLIYCNGVFHHIPVEERAKALSYIWKGLKPGGLFALWENNAWNPGTRYVMSRIPFDRDAVTITSSAAEEMLRNAGFQALRTDFLFLFPRQLGFLRPIEPLLVRMPLGGQYQVLCRKLPK
jgi:SAM-dependent methyltransferase